MRTFNLILVSSVGFLHFGQLGDSPAIVPPLNRSARSERQSTMVTRVWSIKMYNPGGGLNDEEGLG
jgi:hypothetical protein